MVPGGVTRCNATGPIGEAFMLLNTSKNAPSLKIREIHIETICF
jgi:hypothetical protein